MTKSGITRRIDELGRIVVPKEIRYNLGIREGEPLEIYTEDNAIIIKKYSQVENIKDLSQNICHIIYDVCKLNILVSDREKIIAGSEKVSSVIGTNLDTKFKELIDNRESYISTEKETFFNISAYYTIVPIITSLNSCGLIFIIDNEKNAENIKFAKIVQKLILDKIDVA